MEVTMTFDELKEEVQQDLYIDENHLDQKSLEIPKIYGKYLEYFKTYSKAYTRKKHELDSKYNELYEYYATQYSVKLKGNEIHIYVKAHQDYQKIDKQLNEIKNIIEYLDGVLKQINQISFHIRNSIEYRKFKEGLL